MSGVLGEERIKRARWCTPLGPSGGGGGGGNTSIIDGGGDVPLDRIGFSGHQYWHSISKSA